MKNTIRITNGQISYNTLDNKQHIRIIKSRRYKILVTTGMSMNVVATDWTFVVTVTSNSANEQACFIISEGSRVYSIALLHFMHALKSEFQACNNLYELLPLFLSAIHKVVYGEVAKMFAICQLYRVSKTQTPKIFHNNLTTTAHLLMIFGREDH